MTLAYIRLNFPFFRHVHFVNDPNQSVAFTRIKTRELFINTCKFNQLPFEHQFFIIAHEEGHNILHTKDELLADAHAYERYEKHNFSNKEAVKLLHQSLDSRNPVHAARIFQQYQRSLKNDFTEFGIQSARRNHYATIVETRNNIKKQLYGR